MAEFAGMRDITEARVPDVTETAWAEQVRARGRRVVQHRGRLWQQVMPGFYRPVHLMARLSASEATQPTPACWGFQACLAPGDTHLSNASMPTHVISDLGSFDEDLLPKGRRNNLRRARNRAQLVVLTDPLVLHEQGYEVLVSAHERTGYGPLPRTREEYVAGLARFTEPSPYVVLAGLVDGRLAGYLVGYAVDGSAYAADGVVATWALRTNISAGLFYEFVYACRRTGTITEIVDGLHARENEGLSRSRELNGIPVVRVPARLSLLPGVASVLRRRDPHKYYRLSGRE